MRESERDQKRVDKKREREYPIKFFFGWFESDSKSSFVSHVLCCFHPLLSRGTVINLSKKITGSMKKALNGFPQCKKYSAFPFLLCPNFHGKRLNGLQEKMGTQKISSNQTLSQTRKMKKKMVRIKGWQEGYRYFWFLYLTMRRTFLFHIFHSSEYGRMCAVVQQ